MRYHPHEYQKEATRWVIDHPRCCLFLDMGLGKTVSTLTALQDLMDDCEVRKALVVAPKKVAETTWSDEAAKWDHLAGLRVAKVAGTARQRENALESDADVYVIGRDNFAWLCGRHKGSLPYDAIVIDELTSFKNASSLRFKAMRLAASGVKRVIGLTGTPAPNGYIDLWAQLYCVDRGERLGRLLTRYRETYFTCQQWNHIIVRCDLKKGAKETIDSKLSDICLTMQAKDYLQLPPLIERDVPVTLPPETMERYKKFEREKVLQFASEWQTANSAVYAASAAALMNKLSQFANGAVYDDNGDAKEVHGEKLDALCEIVEAANGGGVLVFYQYRHDAGRISAALRRRMRKGFRVETYKDEATLADWNAGKIDALLAHPSSTAYGLNMQDGGNVIVWFGTGWNLELYQQANARLHRQGQKRPVIAHRLITRGTVDERAARSIEEKKSLQQSLLDSLNHLIEKYRDGEG